MTFPTEILLSIISEVSEFPERQPTLASCCRVSRQWYSATIERLYERPHITSRNYDAFIRTICSDTRAKAGRDLGCLIRRLNMSELQHSGSNSLTSRLLGRVKDNLEHFTAPMFSFSELSFLPISKMKKLRVLNLEFVPQPLQLIRIKAAITNLDRLTSLTLPKTVHIQNEEEANAVPWPPNLTRLRVNRFSKTHESAGARGRFLSLGPLRFIPPRGISWPEKLTSLTMSARSIGDVPDDSNLSKSLRRLRLDGVSSDHGPYINIFSGNRPVVRNLTFLSIPGEQFTAWSLESLIGSPVLNLTILDIGRSYRPIDGFPLEQFKEVLKGCLRNLRRLGFHEMHLDSIPGDLLAQLDKLLAEQAKIAGHAPSDKVGVYIYDGTD